MSTDHRTFPSTTTSTAKSASPVPCDDPVVYTPAEAATRLRVRESWLRKKAAARQIPCTFLGRHLRFSPADLAAIVAAAARPAGARKPRRRNGSTTRRPDLPAGAESSVDASRQSNTSDGSSATWPG